MLSVSFWIPGSRAALAPRNDRVNPIHFSNSQFFRRRASSPVLFIEAPGRPVFPWSLFAPPDARGWRARGRCRRRFKIRTSLRRCGSASRRATRTSSNARAHLRSSSFRFAHSRKRNACAGPRFRGRPLLLLARRTRRSVSQLLAGGSYWPPGGAPAPPGCLGGAFVSRPRAPHPAPSSDASR